MLIACTRLVHPHRIFHSKLTNSADIGPRYYPTLSIARSLNSHKLKAIFPEHRESEQPQHIHIPNAEHQLKLSCRYILFPRHHLNSPDKRHHNTTCIYKLPNKKPLPRGTTLLNRYQHQWKMTKQTPGATNLHHR